MSKLPAKLGEPQPSELERESDPNRGPNLFVLYALLALGLLAAMAFAAMVIRPFYLRR